MKKLFAAFLLSVAALPAQADIITLSGLQPIAAPSVVGFNFLVGTPYNQVIFAERQGVTLLAPLVTDSGIIPAGSVVDSWFTATNDGLTPVVIAADLGATFNGSILGIVYQSDALFRPSPNYLTTNFLGAPGTTYNLGPDCWTCGYETFQILTDQFGSGLGFDSASFSGNTFSGHSIYGQPGDYARIIVQNVAAVPGPIAGAGVPGAALAALWLLARLRLRRRRRGVA